MYIASLLIKLWPISVSYQCCHGDGTRKLHTSRNIAVLVSGLNSVSEVGDTPLCIYVLQNYVESGYLSVLTGRIPF